MQNYHRHSSYSNILTNADSACLNEEYAKRAVEVGHKVISSVEHGWQGYYYETYELAHKYGLKCVIGAEAYWVKDRQKEYLIDVDEKTGEEKWSLDRSNNHIILLAKNNNGRESINDILSEASLTGFYRRPRIDLDLLMSLPPDDVLITTACIAFDGYTDIDSIIFQLAEYFGKNFMLEVQYHNTEKQKIWNAHLAQLSRENGIEMIAGLDSHYIYPEDNVLRDDLLASRGTHYDDEIGWYLDYPDDATTEQRFVEQNVLTHDEIKRVMSNCNVTLEFADYDAVKIFQKDIKLPTLYPDKTTEEKNEMYRHLINDKLDEYLKDIPIEEHQKYRDAVGMEVQTYIDTGMVDYPLLDYEIVKDAVAHGGLITDSGRGCFTEDALIHTNTDLKKISEVKVGDKVIDMYGHFNKVINTLSYEIDEELIQIKYMYGSVKEYPNICTKDHKIFIHRNGKNEWIKASEIVLSDYVCLPKIKELNDDVILIDLCNYADDKCTFDDRYIYEYSPYINNKYPYSPKEISEKFGVSKKIIEDYANGIKDDFPRYPGLLKQILDYIPFGSTKEYRRYIKFKRTKQVNRYIPMDFTMGQFIGLMYGDGCNRQDRGDVTLAINTENRKNTINRDIFNAIALRLGLGVSENKSNNRSLSDLTICSRTLSNFISKELFISIDGTDKQFNAAWFNAADQVKRGILNGLFLSDGSNKEEGRKSFDNTSSSLINAYKILSLGTENGILGLITRAGGKDSRGYNRKKSYKLRASNSVYDAKKRCERCLQDNDYWYLPVKDIEILPKRKTRVYDLTVDNSHSFLVNNMIVHNSAVGYMTNSLCGFSSVDRLKADIKLYPERFISTTRILETKSLPDIDLNVGTVSIFKEAQEHILGKDHAVPMIAFGTLKKKAAFKLYAKSQGIDFSIANIISNQISEYDEAVKNADDDDKADINIYDYVDERYRQYIERSERYWGVISDKKQAPSAYLLYQGDIRREIGLIKCKSESTGKEVITCVIDGAIAENYKFLKNDILKVDVVLLIDEVFKRIGINHFSVPVLLDKIKNDEAVWDIYANGYTIGINQVEKEGSREKCRKYKPHNISELSAFVAAIRPGFKSMYKRFENREDFSWGIPALDNLLRTEQLPVSFLFFQEQVMAVLNYAGFPMDQCYGIIKAIAKKHPEKVKPLKAKFIDGFKQKLIDVEGLSESEAQDNADKVWTIVNDNCGYSFNSSHAYCMALDSLYQAWQKAHYPYEFYETLLQFYTDKGKKDKVQQLKGEMQRAFGIQEGAYDFGADNRKFTADKEHGCIYPALSSIKQMNNIISEELFALKDNAYNNLTELLVDIKDKTSINSGKLNILIRIGYFKRFGSMIDVWNFAGEEKDGDKKVKSLFAQLYGKKTVLKSKADNLGISHEVMEKFSQKSTEKSFLGVDSLGLLNYLWDNRIKEEDNPYDLITYQKEYLGYIQYTNEELSWRYVCVTNLDTRYSPKFSAYCLQNGNDMTMKIHKKKPWKDKSCKTSWTELPLQEGDIVYISKCKREPN